MKRLSYFLLAAIGSLLLYGGVLVWVVGRPLTTGFWQEAIDHKRAYAATVDSPKLLILGGSNALFGFRCETIEPILDMPCVNAALTAGLPSRYLFRFARSLLERGDRVLLPLEFTLYEQGANRPTPDYRDLLFLHDRAALAELDPARFADLLFRFGFRDFVSGILETGLAAAGVRRRYGIHTMTPNGDIFGHTRQKARLYAAMVRTTQVDRPGKDLLARRVNPEIVEFLRWAGAQGITVIGTLPISPEWSDLGPDAVKAVASVYRLEGQRFLLPPDLNRFGSDCLYDTPSHLNEACQIEQSRRLAEVLRRMFSLRPNSDPS